MNAERDCFASCVHIAIVAGELRPSISTRKQLKSHTESFGISRFKVAGFSLTRTEGGSNQVMQSDSRRVLSNSLADWIDSWVANNFAENIFQTRPNCIVCTIEGWTPSTSTCQFRWVTNELEKGLRDCFRNASQLSPLISVKHGSYMIDKSNFPFIVRTWTQNNATELFNRLSAMTYQKNECRTSPLFTVMTNAFV